MPTGQLDNPGRIEVTESNPLENAIVTGEYHIVVTSGRVENVGFDGPKPTAADFVVKVPRGQSATLSHIYLGDGETGGQDYNSSAGIFAHKDHAGSVTIDELNIGNFNDNAAYLSAPGNPPEKNGGGGKGTFALTNCYGGNSPSSVFRLGTNGSSATNCVVDDTAFGGSTPRAYWSYYERNGFDNCRARTGGTVMQVSSSAWGNDLGSTAVVKNSSYSGDPPDVKVGGKIEGEWLEDTVSTSTASLAEGSLEVTSVDEPDSDDPNDQLLYRTLYDAEEDTFQTLALDLRPPGGVPMSAQEAQDGTSSADGASVPAGSPTTGSTTPTPTTGGTFDRANCEFVEYSQPVSARPPPSTGGTAAGAVDPSLFVSQEGALGGGAGYERTIEPIRADTTVTTAADLQSTGN